MPGGAHDVRAQDPAGIVGLLDLGIRGALQAQAQGPLGGGEVLGLHRAQPGHHLAGGSLFFPAEKLIGKASPGDIQGSKLLTRRTRRQSVTLT